MSEFASTPIDRMSLVGNGLPQDDGLSLKRDAPKRKPRESDPKESEDPEERGRQVDVEA